MGCTYLVKVRANSSGQKLYVKSISGEHNHPVTKVSHLDCMRRKKSVRIS